MQLYSSTREKNQKGKAIHNKDIRSADSLGFSGIVVKPIEEIVRNTCPNPKPGGLERKIRPQKEQALNCPRCNSTNTKFCYYNNYSLTQPRYFCKTCRRYWTEGGSLRNIPVGGGSRKNKRSSSLSSSQKLPGLVTPPSLSQCSTQNPKIHDEQDLNLAFPAAAGQGSALGFGVANWNLFKGVEFFHSHAASRSEYCLYIGGYGGLHGVQETTGRLLFPFEDLKQVPSNTDIEQHKEQGDSAGYWSGMLGGGSWLASLKVIHGHTMLRTQQKGNPIKYKYK
ncbi:hypothetical protein V6N13_036494 [Hibiscus sabdariffa]